MGYEYKCVGAPERPRKQRGARSRSDRVAVAMQEIITAEAVDGWEYLRTDLVPVEEKSGFFSRAHEVHRAVMVFRRDQAPARPAAQRLSGTADRDTPMRDIPGRDAPSRNLPPRDATAGFEPAPEPARGGEGRFSLAAERGAPATAAPAATEPASRGTRDEPPAPGTGRPTGLD